MMKSYLWKWLSTSIGVFLIAKLLDGVWVADLKTAVWVSAILGLLNLLLKPLLIILTLPLTVLSLGFFILIINAVLFQFAGSLVSGFRVDSFGTAFLASLLLSFFNWITQSRIRVLTPGDKPVKRARKSSTVVDLEESSDGSWR